MSEAATPSLKEVHPLRAVFHFFTSLKLCVVILALCALGIFLGTLAQVHEGLYEAQERWFKSWFIFRRPGDEWWVWFYPGGYLLGVILIINLTGAHLRRIKFPPGGIWVMLLHYAAMIGAIYGITRWLMYGITVAIPSVALYFFLIVVGLLILDMLLCSPGPGFKFFRASGRKIGVDLVHVGIVVLLVGQLVTDMLATETHMSFREGQTMRYSESRSDTELTFTRDVPNDPKNDEVVAVPQALLVDGERPAAEQIKSAQLPFTVKVKSWQPNSELVSLETAAGNEATLRQALATVEARYASAESLPEEARRAMESPGRLQVWKKALKEAGVGTGDDIAAGVEKMVKDPEKAGSVLKKLKAGFRAEMLDRFKQQDANARYAAERVERDPEGRESPPEPQASSDVARRYRTVPLTVSKDMESRSIPSAVVEIIATTGSLGTWLLSPNLREQTIDYGGTKWRISLRIERTYYPFSLTLLKATNDIYAGTDIPKDYRSRLRIENPETNEKRETEIYMNAPLRYEGLTFFQYQMGKDELDRNVGTSALQVVKNPAAVSPYFGCTLVAYGMLRHFLLHLFRFIRKRTTP